MSLDYNTHLKTSRVFQTVMITRFIWTQSRSKRCKSKPKRSSTSITSTQLNKLGCQKSSKTLPKCLNWLKSMNYSRDKEKCFQSVVSFLIEKCQFIVYSTWSCPSVELTIFKMRLPRTWSILITLWIDLWLVRKLILSIFSHSTSSTV